MLHLVSIHRSKKVREAGIQLCKTILIDTRDVWREKKVDIRDLQSLTIDYKNKRKKSGHEIIATAMESCLIFSGDEYGKKKLGKIFIFMNHPHVKHVALKNIEFITKSVGALDMSELFLVNFDYLVE